MSVCRGRPEDDGRPAGGSGRATDDSERVQVSAGTGGGHGRAGWDPIQYERFRKERSRPFRDLLARIPDGDVRRVADLGCGTGDLTRLLPARWPAARVWGVDSSPEMLERGRLKPCPERLQFVEADLRQWTPESPLDRVISNAALQWVPDHRALLERLAGFLAPGGVLGVQVPANQDQPSHRIVAGLLAAPEWVGRLPAGLPRPSIESPSWYANCLAKIGLRAEVWESICYHDLPEAAEVVEWLKGSTLRPILAALGPAGAAEFLAELTPQITAEYRGRGEGVLFPFRRLFFIATVP